MVDVRVIGNARVLTPAGSDWSSWAENGTEVTADFCANRDQPAPQERSWQA